MIKTIIEKELKLFIQSPKFMVTFIICGCLIILSVYLGIQEYRANVKAFEAGRQMAEQGLNEQTSWAHMNIRVFRTPDPMHIFVSGINNDIGRWSDIQSTQPVKLLHSHYSDDPIFAIFRFIDFSIIVMLIFSLLAILFTFDAVNGEKEQGTLRLVFANNLPRYQYIAAKFLGSWTGLVLPIIIPILLSVLMILIYKVPMEPGHWIKFAMLLMVSIIYFTFFIALGILISSITRHSSASFLILLVIWVLTIFIIPKIGTLTASRLVPVQSIAEIESQIDGYSKQQQTQLMDELQKLWQGRNEQMAGMNKDARARYQDEHMWQWMLKEDSLRSEKNTKINRFSRLLFEDVRNRKLRQEQLSFTLSRLSPASTYQLTSMNLAETDIHLKSRYEQALEQYKKLFVDYTNEKHNETGQMGGIRITMDSEAGMKIESGRDVRLDVSAVPRFKEIKQSIKDIITPSLIDIMLLIVYTASTITGAFVAFLKYDLR